MIRNRSDQAAGLRELATFQPSDSVRVITVTGGRSGVGKTSTVINLATALAKMGKRILIIDENPCHNSVNDNLGLKARYELLDVINRDKTLEQVILQGADNIFILSAVHGIHAIAKLNSAEQAWLIKHFGELAKPVDVVLVDTAIGSGSHVLPFSLASQKVLIVLSKSATSITDAYALIKIMSKKYAKQHFFILVNKAESEHDAQVIFDHVSKVTQQYLSVTLDFIGYVQNDEKLQRSAQLCKAVIDVFPASQSAICFRRIAENIMYSCCPDDYGGGMENFMQRLIRTSHLTVTNFTV